MQTKIGIVILQQNSSLMKSQIRIRLCIMALFYLYGQAMAQTDVTNLPGAITMQYDGSPLGEHVEHLIDNDANTKFLTYNSAAWVKFQHGNPSVITKYTITSASDADTRDPLNWTLQGSNDDVSWTALDSRTNEDFPTRLLKREFLFNNSASFTYYRLDMTNNSGTILQVAEWELIGTGGGGVIPIPVPPATWQEHWFEHDQLLSLVYYDNDVAVYYDKDVDRSVTWPYKYIGDVWRYTKKTYGDYGNNPRLYAVLHTGRFPGGHPAGFAEASHDFRNTLDVGPGPWSSLSYESVAIPTHEVCHIVEGNSKGIHNSPAFGLWGDSKWAEIYNYDVYRGLGLSDYATQWYNEQIVRSDDFPRAGTHWFRDWFYPIYNQHGESKVLNNYFTLLAQCFPKVDNYYARDMNWGEFVHFWSGAAGVNLKPLATQAFGWPAAYEAQFNQARLDFPCLDYDGITSLTKSQLQGIHVSFYEEAKQIKVTNENSPLVKGSIKIYSVLGQTVLKNEMNDQITIMDLSSSTLKAGLYIVVVESEGGIYSKQILVR